MIELYWRIGQYLHQRIEADGWAKATVEQLAAYIVQREPGRRGFSARNVLRMRQFFQAYPSGSKPSTLLREIPWSSHLHILSRAKREFYLRVTAQQAWQVREVARQSRTLSPALVAQYKPQLPDKQMLAAKLHEFYALSAPQVAPATAAAHVPGRKNRAS